MTEIKELKQVPLLALRSNVLFPYTIIPVSVGRPESKASVEVALASDPHELFVVAQRDAAVEEAAISDLYTIGTLAVVKKSVRRPDGMIDLIVQGVERAVVVRSELRDKARLARVVPLPMPAEKGPEVEALHREVQSLFARLVQLARGAGAIDPAAIGEAVAEPLRLAYLLATFLNLDSKREQALLEAPTVADALRLAHQYLSNEVQVQELRAQIADKAESKMDKEQREYLLRQQLRAIQEELGEGGASSDDTASLREKVLQANLPEEVRKEALREIERLARLSPVSPEQSVTRAWVDLVLELPWNIFSEEVLDLPRARQVLNEDHFGLKEIKERIVEHLGVLKLNPNAKAPILCFVGPPGVGKTSLGQSIARAVQRPFERMSLGGLHDEAELRGHRRTYVGAMAGRIIHAIRRAGSRNPVLMLDEIDKLGRDFRGDPAFALLEILDPEQNREFRDNYLDLPFDLSKVFFITTANTLETIPRPLLDRMEVVRLSGYSDDEKIQIAQRYLIGRQFSEAGLDPKRCSVEESALREIITRYTREAGVRQLERTLARLVRKVALRFAEGNADHVTLRVEDLEEMLGPEPYFVEPARSVLEPGVAAGLAWTPTGGEMLYIEATLLPGAKGLTLTGQLGDVMQESGRTALSFIWANAGRWLAQPEVLNESGIHIHVPAGAVPKDGPSAGVTIAAALASLLSGQRLRADTAMTGEISLTGIVMPVGGVKEKVLAARRAGIARVLLPRRNLKDLHDLPEDILREIAVLPVDTIEEAIEQALETLPQANETACG